MIKFTPGEWIVKELLSTWGVFAVNEGERTGVADCLEYADARLIAHAPEMYDELYEALQLLQGKSSYDGDEFSQQAKHIRELLARIDGEEGSQHEI